LNEKLFSKVIGRLKHLSGFNWKMKGMESILYENLNNLISIGANGRNSEIDLFNVIEKCQHTLQNVEVDSWSLRRPWNHLKFSRLESIILHPTGGPDYNLERGIKMLFNCISQNMERCKKVTTIGLGANSGEYRKEIAAKISVYLVENFDQQFLLGDIINLKYFPLQMITADFDWTMYYWESFDKMEQKYFPCVKCLSVSLDISHWESLLEFISLLPNLTHIYISLSEGDKVDELSDFDEYFDSDYDSDYDSFHRDDSCGAFIRSTKLELSETQCEDITSNDISLIKDEQEWKEKRNEMQKSMNTWVFYIL
jgi:hypothetical protein